MKLDHNTVSTIAQFLVLPTVIVAVHFLTHDQFQGAMWGFIVVERAMALKPINRPPS